MTEKKRPHKEANRLSRILDTLPPEERYPVDIPKVALELTPAFNNDPITEVQGDNFNKFEGALLKDPANPRWGILYNTKIQHPGRIRFTLAHELGHYMLHRQNAGLDGFECGAGDMLRYDTGYTAREEEANAFAACLLMPAHDFRRQVENERFSFDLLGHCADRYGVSLTSAVLRWLEFTSKRAIAVFSEDGYMHWAKSSDKAFKSGKYFATRRGPIEVPAGNTEADITLINALIRAHRWNRWLARGKYDSVKEIATDEGITSPSYASRILRLVLLAPDIQEAILSSTHPANLTLADFMDPFPHVWELQRKQFGF